MPTLSVGEPSPDSQSLLQTPNDHHANAANTNVDGDPDHPVSGDQSPGPGAETSQVDSDDDDEDSEDESEEDEQEEARLGPIERLRQRLKNKQQKWMDARRHPILEWKAEENWKREHESYRLSAEIKRRQIAAIEQERHAERERKHKRKAQQRLTKQKEVEFRETLFQYEVDVTKSEVRSKLIAKFAREDARARKKRAEDDQEAERLHQEQVRQQQLIDALETDQRQLELSQAYVRENVEVADEFGRRIGLLPAINPPPPRIPEDQDETSTVLILRLNVPEAKPVTEPQNELPAVVPQGGLRLHSREVKVTSPTSAPQAKRLFFTVNLKRFKHVEEIKGEAIGDLGGVELARSLLTGACPRVKTMYLGWNQLKHSAMVKLADAFVRGACGQLQILDLRCNCIDAHGMTTLLGALDQGGLPELKELVLQGNTLGDDGARALAHAMLRGTLKVLRVIDIRQNRIRDAGILALWNVFSADSVARFCPKLTLLDLKRNEAHPTLTKTLSPCPAFLEL